MTAEGGAGDRHRCTWAGGAAWTYEWDAENRLIAAAPAAPASVQGAQRVVYDYDYRARMVRRRVYNWDTQTSAWATKPTVDTRQSWPQLTTKANAQLGVAGIT